MKIRYADGNDIDFLVKGRRQIRIAEKREGIETQAYDKRDLAQAVRKRNVRVIDVDGKPAGFLWFRPGFRVMYMDSYLWVHLIYVEEGFRHRGIGRTLYDDAARIARGMGMERIVIDVFKANGGSIGFHREMGFKPIYAIYQKPV